MPWIGRIFFALFAALTIPFGLWTASKGFTLATEASQSSSWPWAPGQIVKSHVRVSVSHGRHSSTSYTPEIDYTYAVDGTSYTGTMIAPGRMWGSKSAYAAVNAHPSGAATDVRYDPAHPATCVLEPGLRGASFSEALMGIMMVTFGSIFALAIMNIQPTGSRIQLRSGTLGGKMIFGLIGLLVAEIAVLIWLS